MAAGFTQPRSSTAAVPDPWQPAPAHTHKLPGQSLSLPHLQLPPLQVVLPPSEQLVFPWQLGAGFGEQWLLSGVPVPVQLFPEQPLQVTHVPLWHWLSLVHQHCPLL
jgi:hypothetical protein